MSILEIAFEKNWFYFCLIAIGIIYGLGGLVHIGNIFGFGEKAWLESPLSWRVGDIVWGALDLVAVVAILMKMPIGIWSVLLAGLSQILVYSLFPDLFALTEEHHATLKGMVYFHVVILAALGVLVYLAGIRAGS